MHFLILRLLNLHFSSQTINENKEISRSIFNDGTDSIDLNLDKLYNPVINTYNPLIFKFSEDLRKKILECRVNANISFSKNEIKELLYYGIPAFESELMYQSIYRNLITGSHKLIIDDFLDSIKKSLIRITVEKIIKDLFNEMVEIDIYDLLYKNNFYLLKIFNKLLNKTNKNNIVDFIKKLSHYISIETKDNKFNPRNKKFREKTSLFEQNIYERQFKKIIKIDEIRLNISNRGPTCEIIEKIFSFLNEEILEDLYGDDFRKENGKILFALDYLYTPFLDFCQDNFNVRITCKSKNFLEVESNLKKSQTINVRFEEIDVNDALLSGDMDCVSSIEDFIGLHKTFLNFIIARKPSYIKINNFIIDEFKNNKIISLKSVSLFSNFCQRLDINKYSITFGMIIQIFLSNKSKMHESLLYEEETFRFFLRYILRKSCELLYNTKFFERRLKEYLQLYNLLNIPGTGVLIHSIPLNDDNSKDRITNVEEEIVNFLSNNKNINKSQCLYSEFDNSRVKLIERNLKNHLNHIYMCVNTHDLHIETSLNVNLICNSNLYFIILKKCYQKVPILDKFNNIMFKNPVFPQGKIYIHSSKYLDLIFFQMFRVYSRGAIWQISSLIKFQNEELKVMRSGIEVYFIPKMIKRLFFKTCFISKANQPKGLLLDRTIYIGKKKYCFLLNCTVREKLKINDTMDEFYLEWCTLRGGMEIAKNVKIRVLIMKHNGGEILFHGIKLHEISFFGNFITIKEKNLKIVNYSIESIFDIDMDIGSLEIDKCILSKNIIITYFKIAIRNSTGNISIFFNNENQKIGDIILSKNSSLEVDTTKNRKFIIMKNLHFSAQGKSELNINPEFKIIFDNCTYDS